MKILTKSKAGNVLAAKAEQALVRQLPIEQKTLTRAMKLMEPKNLKRLGILVVGGALTFSFIGRVSEMRMYRMAMGRELKKQLEPVHRKLDELEAQNEELKRQNEELRKLCGK